MKDEGAKVLTGLLPDSSPATVASVCSRRSFSWVPDCDPCSEMILEVFEGRGWGSGSGTATASYKEGAPQEDETIERSFSS